MFFKIEVIRSVNTNKVILFPTLKKSLENIEKECYVLIKEKEYERALKKLTYLLSHRYTSYDIHISILICYIKLQRFSEAEEYYEQLLLHDNDPNYYDYLEYYLMVLYERNQYTELMTIIQDEEKKNIIPTTFQKKFQDIYRLAYQMNLMSADQLIVELEAAVNRKDHQAQWHIFQKWLKLNVDPHEIFFTLLIDPKVHPVLKTAIIELLQARNVESRIEVEKFGKKTSIELMDLPAVTDHPIYHQTLTYIHYIDQDNPSLFTIIEKLHNQFHYVRYPYLYPEQDIRYVGDALIQIAIEDLSLPLNHEGQCERIIKYIEMIRLCNKLYVNICPD